MRLAWMVQPFCQPLNDPAALHHLAHKHRTRVAGQAFDASLDYHASVEARMEGRWRAPMGCSALAHIAAQMPESATQLAQEPAQSAVSTNIVGSAGDAH